jgi:transketolase N-terminal domain/subunit
MAHDDKLIRDLAKKADIVRRNVFTIFNSSQMGHAGGTMSLVDIVTALYFHHLKFDPENCDWPERYAVYLLLLPLTAPGSCRPVVYTRH